MDKTKPHPMRTRFREQREQKYTSSEAAAILGLSRQALGAFELGPGKPQMALIYRRCSALGLDVEYVKDC